MYRNQETKTSPAQASSMKTSTKNKEQLDRRTGNIYRIIMTLMKLRNHFRNANYLNDYFLLKEENAPTQRFSTHTV